MKTVNCPSCRYFGIGFYTEKANCRKGRRLYFVSPKPDFSNEGKWGYRRKCKLYKPL